MWQIEDNEMPTSHCLKIGEKNVQWHMVVHGAHGGTWANRDPEILKRGGGDDTTHLHAYCSPFKIPAPPSTPPAPGMKCMSECPSPYPWMAAQHPRPRSQPACLSVCLPICRSLRLFNNPSVRVSVYLPVSLGA